MSVQYSYLKIKVFWDVTLRDLVSGCRHTLENGRGNLCGTG